MIRLAVLILLVTAGIWFVAFYPMGDKPLAAHLREVYTSPLVQKKLDALEKGVDKKVEQAHRDAKKLLGNNEQQAHTEAKTKLARAPMAPVISTPEPARRPIVHSTSVAKPDHKEPPATRSIVDVRPSSGAQKTPAQDTLTTQDRDGLDSLLANKLKR